MNNAAEGPLATIQCLVYNHEPYLRQCLDGFVMQKANFPFEVIIHDDASTDGSAAIIQEYAEKYPDIIKPIYEIENQWGKGTIRKTMDAAMHPSSKYVAFCEGDDYWCDPHKLQMQVSFLESHPDYYMTCHAFKYYMQDEEKFVDHDFVEGLPMEQFEGHEYCTPTTKEYFASEWFTQLLTLVRRREPFVSKDILAHYTAYDYIVCYYMMKKGKCALFKDVMGVYRKQSGGVFSGTDPIEWKQQSFKQNMMLYHLENEKLVIPKINGFFAELLKDYTHQHDYGKAASLAMKYLKGIRFTDLCGEISRKVTHKPR